MVPFSCYRLVLGHQKSGRCLCAWSLIQFALMKAVFKWEKDEENNCTNCASCPHAAASWAAKKVRRIEAGTWSSANQKFLESGSLWQQNSKQKGLSLWWKQVAGLIVPCLYNCEICEKKAPNYHRIHSKRKTALPHGQRQMRVVRHLRTCRRLSLILLKAALSTWKAKVVASLLCSSPLKKAFQNQRSAPRWQAWGRDWLSRLQDRRCLDQLDLVPNTSLTSLHPPAHQIQQSGNVQNAIGYID